MSLLLNKNMHLKVLELGQNDLIKHIGDSD